MWRLFYTDSMSVCPSENPSAYGQQWQQCGIVVGVMKMGNILPRVGIGPTSQAFKPSTLTITPPRLPWSWCHHYTHTYMSMQLLAWEAIAAYYIRHPGIVSFLALTITYIQAFTSHTHRVRSTIIQRIACTGSWSWNHAYMSMQLLTWEVSAAHYSINCDKPYAVNTSSHTLTHIDIPTDTLAHIDILTHWHIDTPTHWHIDTLTH